MPIDPNIALSGKGLQLQDPMEQYARFSAIQNAQQQNALAAAQLDEYKQKVGATNAMNAAYARHFNTNTGEVNHNAMYADLAKNGYGSQIPGMQEAAGKASEARTKAQESEVKLLDAALNQSRQFLESIDPNSPDAAQQYLAWHEANHANPIIGKALAARGITADQSRARIMQAAQTPGGLAKLIYESKLGTDKFIQANKPQLFSVDSGGMVQEMGHNPLTGEVTTVANTKKTLAPGEARRIANEERRIQLAEDKAARDDSGIPKLKQGEVYNAELDRIEAKPGSELYVKQSKVHANDYKAANATIIRADNSLAKINKILAPENEDAFANNFGGYNAAVTRMLPGAATNMRKTIDSFKSDLKNAGLELMRQGGSSIGQITVREWDILEQLIANIDYNLTEDEARNVFNKIKEQLDRTKMAAQDAYDTQWGETQYHKGLGKGNTGTWSVVK